MTEQKKKAKTTAERQAALRKRCADEGLAEVRGVYAKPENHAKVKAFAKSLEIEISKDTNCVQCG